MEITKHLKNLFSILIIYFFGQILEGLCKLTWLNTNALDTIALATISSQLNMVFSAFFSIAIVMVLYFVLYNFINLFTSTISYERLIVALTKTVILYVFFTVLKICLHLAILPYLNLEEVDARSLYDYLIKSDWYFYLTTCNILMYLFGIIVFAYILFKSEKTTNYETCFATTLCYAICILLILLNL